MKKRVERGFTVAYYDKLVKHLVEKFQTSLAPLQQITRNQEIVIAQNKQIIDLLTKNNSDRESTTTLDITETVNNDKVEDELG